MDYGTFYVLAIVTRKDITLAGKAHRLRVKISAPTPQGFKAIARKGQTAQEVFFTVRSFAFSWTTDGWKIEAYLRCQLMPRWCIVVPAGLDNPTRLAGGTRRGCRSRGVGASAVFSDKRGDILSILTWVVSSIQSGTIMGDSELKVRGLPCTSD